MFAVHARVAVHRVGLVPEFSWNLESADGLRLAE